MHVILSVAAIVAVVLLAMIVIILRRALCNRGLVGNVEGAIKRLTDASTHHIEVNAVLALTKDLNHDPDLLQKLEPYSRTIVAAALLHRVNSLGNDLREAQQVLSEDREQLARYGGSYKSDVQRGEALVADLHSQLDQAHAAVEAFTGPVAVA